LDLKESEKELTSFGFICRTYEEKLKYLCQKLKEAIPLSKQEIVLEDFIMSGIDKNKVASMIYSIYQNHGRGLGFSEGIPNRISIKSCFECIKKGLEIYFVPKDIESEAVIQSEPEASSSKTMNVLKSKNSKSKVMTNSESKTPKIPEPKSQVMKNSESGVLKPKLQRRKTIVVSWDSRPKDVKPKVLNEHKPVNFKHKAQKKKTKTFKTNPKGPIKIWVYLSLKFLMLQICLRGMEKLKSWYLDSGCPRHMTGEKSMFLTLTMKEGRPMGFGRNQNGRIICT